MGLQCFWYEDNEGQQVTDAHVCAIVDIREDVLGNDIKVHVAACGAEGFPQSLEQPHKKWIASMTRVQNAKKALCTTCDTIIKQKTKQLRLERAS